MFALAFFMLTTKIKMMDSTKKKNLILFRKNLILQAGMEKVFEHCALLAHNQLQFYAEHMRNQQT